MTVAVIGAGWAGLAAAVALKDAGKQVTVFEASPVAGGRARRVDDVHMTTIDNGQHLMLGAYTDTLALIQRLHPPADAQPERMLRTALRLESADGRFCLHTPAVFSPLHGLLALLGVRGLGWADRWHALRMVVALRLRGWQAGSVRSVSDLLDAHGQSALLRRRVWVPLCLASLNTSATEACAQLFLNVLRDSLDAPKQCSDLLIPRVDLTTLWPQAAAQMVEMRYRHIVRRVEVGDDAVRVDGESFECCVLAVPPYAAARVLDTTLNPQALARLLAILGEFTYRSIATLTLQLEQGWRIPQPMMMLDEEPGRGHVGQWLFDRPDATQFTVVISDAADFLKYDRDTFVQAIATQVREQIGRHPQAASTMPGVRAHRLIVEKRATFAALPDLKRPANTTPWPRLTLAGDWTDTGYPSVLEGAVRSGQRAARELLGATERAT